MRTLLHLSDLHFGRIDPGIIAALVRKAHSLAPSLVVVSGDLTQRARGHQFQGARRFLDSLSAPWLAVPGNHDIPLFDLPRRFLDPYGNYRRYIGPELEPAYIDEEIAVMGLKTTRRIRHTAATCDRGQISGICNRLQTLPPGLLRVVVTHHPTYALEITELLRGGVDLLLSGHLHSSQVQPSTRFFHFEHRNALFVEAGTATSTRLRGQNNSFNLVQVHGQRISVCCFNWDRTERDFIPGDALQFGLAGRGWAAA